MRLAFEEGSAQSAVGHMSQAGQDLVSTIHARSSQLDQFSSSYADDIAKNPYVGTEEDWTSDANWVLERVQATGAVMTRNIGIANGAQMDALAAVNRMRVT